MANHDSDEFIDTEAIRALYTSTPSSFETTGARRNAQVYR